MTVSHHCDLPASSDTFEGSFVLLLTYIACQTVLSVCDQPRADMVKQTALDETGVLATGSFLAHNIFNITV